MSILLLRHERLLHEVDAAAAVDVATTAVEDIDIFASCPKLVRRPLVVADPPLQLLLLVLASVATLQLPLLEPPPRPTPHPPNKERPLLLLLLLLLLLRRWQVQQLLQLLQGGPPQQKDEEFVELLRWGKVDDDDDDWDWDEILEQDCDWDWFAKEEHPQLQMKLWFVMLLNPPDIGVHGQETLPLDELEKELLFLFWWWWWDDRCPVWDIPSGEGIDFIVIVSTFWLIYDDIWGNLRYMY
jgi:hypothetical protein